MRLAKEVLRKVSTILSVARMRGRSNMWPSGGYNWKVAVVMAAFCVLTAPLGQAQSSQGREKSCCASKQEDKRKVRLPKLAAAKERFAARVDALVDTATVNKGDWGLLIIDAQS